MHVSNKIHILLPGLPLQTLRLFLDGLQDIGPQRTLQEVGYGLMADGMIGVPDQCLIFPQILQNGPRSCPPIFLIQPGADQLLRRILEIPLQQVVDIPEVIVKSLPVHPAVLHDVLYRDLVQFPDGQQLFQGLCQCIFHGIRHSVLPS